MIKLYYVDCISADWGKEYLVKANTKKEAIDIVYSHFEDMGWSFSGGDRDGYSSIPKKDLIALEVDKMLEGKKFIGLS